MDSPKEINGNLNTEPALSNQPSGFIFDIKRFATGDGPGIRTIVFLKGCPMKCIWCANPESQSANGEIIYYKNKCVGCLHCMQVCPNHAVRTDERYGIVTDRELCSLCGNCIGVCYTNARELAGKCISAEEVMKEVMRDRQFYLNTGGGVTLSGGEPFIQSGFCLEILKRCKTEGIHTAIETCGQTKEENVKKILPYLDFIMYDYKHVDSNIHKEYTGCGNEQIIKNLLLLNKCIESQKLIVRIPYIPGFNDSYHTIYRMLVFLSGLKKINWVELMPYHRLGKLKYDGLSIPYQMGNTGPVKKEDLSKYIVLGDKLGLDIKIDAQA